MALKILTAIKSYYPTSMPVNWRWGYYLNSYKVSWLALKELTASEFMLFIRCYQCMVLLFIYAVYLSKIMFYFFKHQDIFGQSGEQLKTWIYFPCSSHNLKPYA